MSQAPSQLQALLERVAVPESGQSLPSALPAEPFGLFLSWFDEEQRAKRTPNPNAMSLASVGADGFPSNRIVLCRGIDPVRGTVTFFTNYRGRKGREIINDPRVAVCFHWDQSDRQVRIEGIASTTSEEESDAYFRSRRWESRLSAWASDQSEPIESREALVAKLGGVLDRLGLSAQELITRGDSVAIPRPAHWGGFTILARSVELWIGGVGRLHDRAVWTREIPRARVLASGYKEFSGQGHQACGPWTATRLQP